jgi:single-stranded-DNA-specific exonuclease
VFLIAPRVNAAGRMDDARKAVLMFVSESYEEAMLWAEQLNADNTNRKEADTNITEEALSLINFDLFYEIFCCAVIHFITGWL